VGWEGLGGGGGGVGVGRGWDDHSNPPTHSHAQPH
jgi:hypothetical protein